jgi:hypothetical protein
MLHSEFYSWINVKKYSITNLALQENAQNKKNGHRKNISDKLKIKPVRNR